MKSDATNANLSPKIVALSKTVFDSTCDSVPIDHTCLDTATLLTHTEESTHIPCLFHKWSTTGGQQADVAAVYAIRNHLLNFYIKHFDDSRTYAQSTIIIGPFLDHFITSIMSRKLYLHEANRSIEKISFKASTRRKFKFLQLRDFTRAIETAEFSEQIYIDLINIEIPKADISMLITEENNLEPYPRKKENAQIKVWLKKQLIKFYNKLVINRATIVISSPHIGAKALAKIFLWSKFKISIFPSDDISEDIIRTSKFPPRKNKRSPRSSPESDFCVYESLFVKYLPLCYSKTQDLGHAVIREFNLPIKPKSIFTANSYQFNELFKAYLVQSCNEPCSLHIAQHGGHYGMGEFNLTEKHEREISDFYWTWGWKDSYYSGATILPTGMIKPKLKARRQRSRHKRRVKLLLIGLAVPKHAYRFYSTPMGVGILNQYLFLRNVLKALSNEKFELHYRLSPNSRGWNQVAIADWIFNGRNFVITESDYTTDIRNSDLVLCINNGTNFLEVCHANVPCLWLLDQTQWSFRESAYNLICRLANARIVHTDPKSAIEFINSVDINDWWHSEAVQSVRDEFCSVFAAESNDFTRLFLERLR